MFARAASSAARLAAAGRLRPAARPRSYHKLIIYGRVQSTPRLEGVDKADASGDSAVAAAAEAAEASAESLPPLRRPTCYFWLSSTVPRFSEWQALSDKRPPPRMRAGSTRRSNPRTQAPPALGARVCESAAPRRL
ncbi:hypothetical protein EMIHUDRAFT_210806 [Emiliania huxleyi CCMP1516]|uniref:Uncharacterized protein n=2 Tax=Emiliania huxleyi TaxID=2903 RepID=A0A0D3IYR6_EMIH1|nr:hypothetical protein EMIHUDRAFT_210806 [Emiliania huxleyi CCMP1516]EOD16401.1 hypothetical protein EMIHUDRAFT_210806 [Emiliania huxleyi CCMP1516]|eukprot:XP_005768830.1 hypothetical protein EMIHUDRAFT_210806 [Emiliania huxleyi CCMP1516]